MGLPHFRFGISDFRFGEELAVAVRLLGGAGGADFRFQIWGELVDVAWLLARMVEKPDWVECLRFSAGKASLFWH